jgi:hypothetical protein
MRYNFPGCDCVQRFRIQSIDAARHCQVSGRQARLNSENSLEKSAEGCWKLVILFKLFGGKLLRFSDLERAILSISPCWRSDLKR